MQKKSELTKNEAEVLKKTLGRLPTPFESRIIGDLWHDYRMRFPYQDIIKRSQAVSDEVPVHEERTGQEYGDFYTIVKGNIWASESAFYMPVTL